MRRVNTSILGQIKHGKTVHKDLLTELLKIEAFNPTKDVKIAHFSQLPYLMGFHRGPEGTGYPVMNMQQSILGLQRALKFLSRSLVTTSHHLVFVGSPIDMEGKFYRFFKRRNVSFHPNGHWKPGFLSGQLEYSRPNSSPIAIIYDPTLNSRGRNEALQYKIPIVGIIPGFSDVRGVDYPIRLNLDSDPTWVLRLWEAFLTLHNIKPNSNKSTAEPSSKQQQIEGGGVALRKEASSS